MPGAATIGMAAPLILLTLRLVQGFAVGGEWAGSALLAAEYAPAEARGRYGMFTQMGVGSGLVMSSLLFLVVNQTIGESSQAFLDWGWRIPFLFSAVLIAIALYVRLNVAETPVFAAQKACETTSVTPLAALFATQRRQVVLASGQHDRVLHVGLHGECLLHELRPYPRRLFAEADPVGRTHGRRRGGGVQRAGGRVERHLRASPRHHLAVRSRCAVVLRRASAVGHRQCRTLRAGDRGHLRVSGTAYGPMAAFIPEIFGTRYRYSGAGLSLNLAGLVGGAVPTIVAAPLLATWGVPAIGVMMATVVLVSLVCTVALPETKGVALQRQ